MGPMLVPRPPYRMSERIISQVNHFKRLETKLPADVRQALPQHIIVTEEDAVQYVESISRFLRARISVAPARQMAPSPRAAPG